MSGLPAICTAVLLLFLSQSRLSEAPCVPGAGDVVGMRPTVCALLAQQFGGLCVHTRLTLYKESLGEVFLMGCARR